MLVLEKLGRKRLLRLAEDLAAEVDRRAGVEELAAAIARAPGFVLTEVLASLSGRELISLCRELGLSRATDKPTNLATVLASLDQPPPRAASPIALFEPEPEPTPTLAPEPKSSAEPPTAASLLRTLTLARLADLGRELGIVLPDNQTKSERVAALSATALALGDVLAWMTRDELRTAARQHGLPDTGRSRGELASRLRDGSSPLPSAIFDSRPIARELPEPGDVVRVRHRQWLVERVTPPPQPKHAHRVALVCLDDDDPGRELEVLWELELGARLLQPEAQGLGAITQLDPPRHFAAYLHALGWSSVTASDAKLFQAPFRAGIRLLDHQLTPLKKALELPRANLFIADDVGLGKTIEAGLVLQELLLRQRVDFVLIVAPASVCLQWRDEMQHRFGLHFELYNREFVARRRQERGFAVNPWATHQRFIISYPLLRRPEHRDPLLQQLASLARAGEKARKSLLILDEAHTAAPASATKYAVDSRITAVIRDVAPRFENRLFLSATPHNGHSNSFSALLELLDPQRFTRGVKPRPAQLRTSMVRRLKSDLRELGVEEFPERKVVELRLEHHDDQWWLGEHSLGSLGDVELQLSTKLAAYTELRKPTKQRSKLVFINLQKRLLSSIEAFWRTLHVHADSAAAKLEDPQLELDEPDDDSEYGEDDETLALTRLPVAQGRARELLDELLTLAARHRHGPDAKLLALLDWIRTHQCPALALGGVPASISKAERRWTDRRVLVFTEYADTKRWLVAVLSAAVEGSDRADARIMQFHGGMSDDQRHEVQRAFNSPPDEHPVRILICTDAAREGVNLQGHCADLFHFDIPWNPARIEQRNGRIDRTLQAEPEVRCHYFVLPQRAEDRVLATIVGKVEIIRRELGSLGSVVMDRLAETLERGIADDTLDALAEAEQLAGRRDVVRDELERNRAELDRLRIERDEAGRILEASKRVMNFEPALLREALDVGFELAGAKPMREDADERGLWHLAELPDSWQPTLDLLRPPRAADEYFSDWRRRPALPIIFHPAKRLDGSRVHLHLAHPLVQRVLGRFLAQGFGTHDLSRVTVVRNRHDHIARVIAFGRLTLFGPGAVRLHDQLVSVAAQWLDSGGEGHLRPFADRADRRALDRLEQLLAESPGLDIAAKVQQRLIASAPGDFANLWPHVRDEADSLAHEVTQKLAARASEEADALRAILAGQRQAIEETLGEADRQLSLAGLFAASEQGQRDQLERDRDHMKMRLVKIEHEIEDEPEEIRGIYRVTLRRLEPVGLVYLWPETRG